MKKIILGIDGMTCSACSNGLEKYLNKQNGIIEASVNLVMANATINYDENILDIEKINKYIKQAGFKSLGIYKGVKEEKKSKKDTVKFIIFTILAIILMYISMGHMLGLPLPDILLPHMYPINYVLSIFIITTLFLIYGADLLKNGFKNLIHLIPNMDTLVLLGVLSSYIYSIFSMLDVFRGNYDSVMNTYFESAAIVIYFVKLGRYIDSFSKDKTKEAVKKLVEITPNKATIIKDEKEKEVTLDEIKKGDILVLKPGEKVAVDGCIIEGTSHFDESFITGESKPYRKKEGDMIVAGSLNYDGYIKYTAQKIGKDSTISQIVRLVIEASNKKTKIEKTADKISGYFVPFVILFAFVTFFVYLFLGFDISTCIITCVTVLVVACPCSLGLATPLAIVVSEGVCIKNGILVKRGDILEEASKIDTAVFDKTGTLTYGKLKIHKMYNYSSLGKEKILSLVCLLEEKSTHPIAGAFVNYMKEKNIERQDVAKFTNLPGFGIYGQIEGKKMLVGNANILEKYGIVNDYKKDEDSLKDELCSIVYVVIDEKIVALVGVTDVLRKETKTVIEKLNKMNIDTVMLTGDSKKVAEKIGNDLGIKNIYSDVIPSQKAEIIQKLKEQGKNTLMCGDGINDSPALANALVGVSISTGTDIAMDSSSVILTKDDLTSIVKLIKISKKTLVNIKQNLFWAFLYNTLMLPIAAGTLRKYGINISPMIASVAMVLSSLTVTINALRLKKIKLD